MSETDGQSTAFTEALGSRRAQFLHGVRLGLPIFLGYVPVGMAFGIVASGLGFSVTQACACSATALAGAGQFIALGVLRAGEGAAAVLAATTVVNLRYLLFSATISPHLKGMRLSSQALLAFTLTDETFAVNINDRRQGLSTGASMAGVGAVAWCGWVGGTFVGAAAAGRIGDPTAWGVDFAMAAMFTALLVAMVETRHHAVTAAVSAVIMLALPEARRCGLDIGSSWSIIAASMTAATVGAVSYRE